MSKWFAKNAEEVLLHFSCDKKRGRSVPAEHQRKSLNNIFRYPKADIGKVFAALNTDAALVLLVVTFVLSAIIGDTAQSLCGIAILFLFYFLASLVKFKSTKRIENSYTLLLPSAKIVENGKQRRLSISDVEAGDLIVFEAGDIIVADARIISCVELKIAERQIDPKNGKVQYISVSKTSDAVDEDSALNGAYSNMVYAGSVVISGSGRAVVVSVGDDTRIVTSASGIVLAKTDDKPKYLESFVSFAKRLSLLILISVIPVTLTALIISLGADTSANPTGNLLYFFLNGLCVAVVSMSELTVLPTESLVTKQFLPSSKRNFRTNSSSVTKLSSADTLADIDTVLILCPEVLYDRKRTLRQVYFSDNYYRFDSLSSADLDYFSRLTFSFFANVEIKKLSPDQKALSNYYKSLGTINIENVDKPQFSSLDDDGITVRMPNGTVHFLSAREDSFESFTHFRYFDGSVRPINEERRHEIALAHQKFSKNGLSVFVFMTIINANEIVFEGLMGVGCEFPYADGELREMMHECGIEPILVLPDENETNINFARNCGIISDDREIALSSEYKSFRRQITDAPIGTKVYIGFGRKGTALLSARLKNAGRRVLPIIKDSAHRRETSTQAVYATHADYSLDSVRLSSSLCLKHTDAQEKSGGLFDCILSILGSTMARLKLGIFKNCLVVAIFMRLLSIYPAILLGYHSILPSSPIILLLGLTFDAVAMSIISSHKGIPVRASDTSLDAERMFSAPVSIVYTLVGSISGLCIVFLTHALELSTVISTSFAPVFFSYAIVFSQIAVLGAFIIIMKKKVRSSSFFLRFSLLVLFASVLPIVNHYLGTFISSLSFLRVEPVKLLFLLIPIIVSFALVLLFDLAVDRFEKLHQK